MCLLYDNEGMKNVSLFCIIETKKNLKKFNDQNSFSYSNIFIHVCFTSSPKRAISPGDI